MGEWPIDPRRKRGQSPVDFQNDWLIFASAKLDIQWTKIVITPIYRSLLSRKSSDQAKRKPSLTLENKPFIFILYKNKNKTIPKKNTAWQNKQHFSYYNIISN